MTLYKANSSTESDPSSQGPDESNGTSELPPPPRKSKRLAHTDFTGRLLDATNEEHSPSVDDTRETSAFTTSSRTQVNLDDAQSPVLTSPSAKAWFRKISKRLPVHPVTRPTEYDTACTVAIREENSLDHTIAGNEDCRVQEDEEEEGHVGGGSATNESPLVQRAANLDLVLGLHVRTPTRPRLRRRPTEDVLAEHSSDDLFAFLKNRRGSVSDLPPNDSEQGVADAHINVDDGVGKEGKEDEDQVILRRGRRKKDLGSSLERWKYVVMMNYHAMKPPKQPEETGEASSDGQSAETPRREEQTAPDDNDSDVLSQKRTEKRAIAAADEERDEGNDVDEDEAESSSKKQRQMGEDTPRRVPAFRAPFHGTPKPPPRPDKLPQGVLPMYSTPDNSFSPSNRNQPNARIGPLVRSPV
ncbi:hypothetical protein BGX34_010193 [Mortierella sp. NVP85]|nr:hypothetical protein BGX34_010193 [Mortierella sp. NVP85]